MIHFLPDPDQVQVAASPFHERVHGLSQALQVLTALGEDAPGAFRAVPELGSNISGMALDLSDRIASASAAGLEAIAALTRGRARITQTLTTLTPQVREIDAALATAQATR